MKTLKLSITSVLVLFSVLTASTAFAKLPPVDLSVAPVNLSVDAPTYGNTTVGTVNTNISPYITGNTSQMANSTSGSLDGYVNGQY